MTEEEKKEFEEFLKWKAEREENAKDSKPTEATIDPIKVDVNAKVNANIAPSLNMGWYQKLTVGEKNLLMVYIIWLIVHVLLVVSGKGKDHFFPRIYKAPGMTDYAHLRQHGWAPVPPEHWTIKWNLDYYGFPEFIIYVVLVPVIVYFIYTLWRNKKKSTAYKSTNQQ